MLCSVPPSIGFLAYYYGVFGAMTKDMSYRFLQVAGCKKKGYCRSERRLDGLTIVITGANAGLGKITAEFLWKRGADVIIVCRSRERGEEAMEDMRRNLESGQKVGTLQLYIMDLASLESVRNCAAELNKALNRIDILINNAGVMAAPWVLTQEGFESQFGVNHLGHFLFTLLLLPKILESTPARIVNVASAAHRFFDDMMLDEINNPDEYRPAHAYFRSKASNIMFTRELAKRLRGKGVNVYACHPGYVTTKLYKHTSDNFVPGFYWIMRNIMAYYIQDLWEGAQSIIHCAICESAEEETGLYYADCQVLTPSKVVRDEDLCKELWDRSLKWVGLDFDPAYISPKQYKSEDEENTSNTSNITAVA